MMSGASAVRRAIASALVAGTLVIDAHAGVATIAAVAGAPASAPAASASMAADTPAARWKAKRAATAVPVVRIDINSASRKSLKTLPGIGDAEAARIIANRPYLSKTELVAKHVLPVGPYVALKNRVVALQKGKSR